MSNQVLGANIYYFDTNGVVNKGLACYVGKVALWAVDTSSYITIASGTGGLPCVKLTATGSGNTLVANAWQETTLHPPQFFSVCSVLGASGSGYVFCV